MGVWGGSLNIFILKMARSYKNTGTIFRFEIESLGSMDQLLDVFKQIITWSEIRILQNPFTGQEITPLDI